MVGVTFSSALSNIRTYWSSLEAVPLYLRFLAKQLRPWGHLLYNMSTAALLNFLQFSESKIFYIISSLTTLFSLLESIASPLHAPTCPQNKVGPSLKSRHCLNFLPIFSLACLSSCVVSEVFKWREKVLYTTQSRYSTDMCWMNEWDYLISLQLRVYSIKKGTNLRLF